MFDYVEISSGTNRHPNIYFVAYMYLRGNYGQAFSVMMVRDQFDWNCD